MNELEKIKPIVDKGAAFIRRNQTFIVVLVVSVILMFSLLKSRAYLNPVRNEDHYNEGVLQIKYSTIDRSILDEISSTLEDKDIEVDSNLEPGRNNPFAE